MVGELPSSLLRNFFLSGGDKKVNLLLQLLSSKIRSIALKSGSMEKTNK